MNGEDTTTLGRDDYCSPAVFAAERHRLFDRGWFYACHADSLPARHRRVVDVAGERGRRARCQGVLHAHANVCRHRGFALVRSGRRPPSTRWRR
jgi:phenylpropionate dioxygenase-like ring-hydroxylating dioxygenase large terminal subunit